MQAQWVVSSFGSLGLLQRSSDCQNKFQTRKKRARENYEKIALNRYDSEEISSRFNEGLWIRKYQPKSDNELAVHKKKVEEVKNWFHMVRTAKCNCRVLLLTGPSGAGKTETVKLLAKQMNFGLKEWVNSPGLSYIYEQNVQGESQISTFREFLLHSSKYASSQIFKEDIISSKHVVLLEEIPHFIFKDPHEFWEILRIYVKCGKHPLIIIITDDCKDSSNERKLLPKALQDELGINHISFNSIAVTSLNRCLKRIVDNENLIVPQALIESISNNSNGDIRTAIHSLQFSSDAPNQSSNRITTKSRYRQNKSAKIERIASTLSTALGSRDESLFLLHALGKILHCKRANMPDEKHSLPTNLQEMERKRLITNPEDVWQKTSTSANNFTAFLHQNYVSFVNDMKNLEWSSGYLSFADLFNSEWTGSDSVSFDPYIFSVAARGVMFCSTDEKVGWKPLNKPQMLDVQKTVVNNTKLGKKLIKEKCCGLSMTDIFLDFIPYISKIKSPHNFADQGNLVIRMGDFYGCQFQKNEDDYSTANNEWNISSCTKSSQNSRSDPSRERTTPQEEFDIEEFE